VFQEKNTSTANPNIYKTNPADSKAEDGHYRCKLRVIYNPFAITESIVEQTTYAMRDSNGFFMVKALPYNQGGKDSCPLFKAWKTVFFANSDFASKFASMKYSGDANAAKREKLLADFNAITGYGKEANEARFGKRTQTGVQGGTELGIAIRQYASENFDRTESIWVLVQIIEDINKPELVGQIKVMKLPAAILAKLEGKMHPAKESGKKPVDLMSWVLGPVLDMDVQPGPDDPKAPERKQREISYDLCEFDTDFQPIIKVDGTPLFSEEQIAILEEFNNARNDVEKAKTEAKRKAAAKLIEQGSDLYNKVREMVGIAYNYLKEVNSVNLVDECAYKEWDEETKKRVNAWIETVTLANFTVGEAAPATTAEAPAEDAGEGAGVEAEQTDEKLPF
jgi:hypothetical protein